MLAIAFMLMFILLNWVYEKYYFTDSASKIADILETEEKQYP